MMTDRTTPQRTESAQHDIAVDDLTSDELEAIIGGGPAQNGYGMPD